MKFAYYQNALAVVAIGVFFTNMPLYLFHRQGFYVLEAPKHWVIAFGMMVLPVLWHRVLNWNLREQPILIWCFAYTLMSVLWFFPSSQSDVAWQEVRNHFMAVIVVFLMLAAFSTEGAIMWARRMLIAAVLFGCAVNFYEVFHPLAFSEIYGRSAGLYLNPNISGAMLVLGMVLSVTALEQRYRVPFILTVGLGVLTTFSRAGMLAWCIVVTGMVFMARGRLKHLFLPGLVGVILVALVVLPQWDEFQSLLERNYVLNENVAERVTWFTNLSLSYDQSTWERTRLAQLGWETFSNHPFLGSGTGTSMEKWEGIGLHNEYLSLIVDHGILGAVVLPLLVVAMICRARGEMKQMGWIFGLIAVWLALTTHMILNRPDTLTLFALMAAMAATSRGVGTRRGISAGEAWPSLALPAGSQAKACLTGSPTA